MKAWIPLDLNKLRDLSDRKQAPNGLREAREKVKESCPGDFQTSKHAGLYRSYSQSDIRTTFTIQRMSVCMDFVSFFHNGRKDENPQITCPSDDKRSN